MTSFYFFDVLESTMDEARLKVLAGAEDGTVIVAYQQNEGRGRRGRGWESSLGNVHLTYITYSNLPLDQAVQLSFVACVAIGEELVGILPPTEALSYKWPNDILLNEKKVGGILLEAMTLSGKKETAYLIGCGLNLKNCPQEVRYPTTSFEKEGVFLLLEDTLRGIGSSLDRYISLWKKEGFAPIRDLWERRAARLGQTITFESDEKVYTGKFEGINEDGLLILKSPQGRLELIAGDILNKAEEAA